MKKIIIGLGMILILGVIMFSGCTEDKSLSCGDICFSQNMTMIKYSNIMYQNPVCYCKDKDGRIFTFVMDG